MGSGVRIFEGVSWGGGPKYSGKFSRGSIGGKEFNSKNLRMEGERLVLRKLFGGPLRSHLDNKQGGERVSHLKQGGTLGAIFARSVYIEEREKINKLASKGRYQK